MVWWLRCYARRRFTTSGTWAVYTYAMRQYPLLLTTQTFIYATASLRWVQETEPQRAIKGTVTAKGPGFGLEWDEGAVARFAAERS